MRVLDDGQFELDGRILMAARRSDPTTVHIQDLSRAKDVRTQDADDPVDDGVRFGRDYIGASTWTFTFAIRGRTAAESFDAVDQLEAAWRPYGIRRTPGAKSVLRYRLNGRTRRVYGRGRKFDPADKQGLVNGVFLPAIGEFTAEPFTYDDQEASLNLGLVTDPGEGLTWPITFPITFGAQAGLRQGVTNVAGEAETPFRVEITGPVTGHATSPTIRGRGWWIELPGLKINYDERVVIDTRARTVTKGGTSVARFLSRRSSLSARLMPGSQELVFGCTDPTNTAAARVFWRPAHYSL